MVRITHELAATIVALLGEVRPGPVRDEALAVLQGQIDRPQWAGELIDKVASLVMRGNARNVIAGDVLQSLRRSLLTPLEMTKIDRMVAQGVTCVSCGAKVRQQELATIHQGDVVCVNCLTPNAIRCNCGRAVQVDIRAKVLRAKRECSACKAAVASGQPVAAPEPVPDGPALVAFGVDPAPARPAPRGGGRRVEPVPFGRGREWVVGNQQAEMRLPRNLREAAVFAPVEPQRPDEPAVDDRLNRLMDELREQPGVPIDPEAING